MSNTVVGLYRTEEDVRRVVDDLSNHGFSRGEINHHDDVGPNLREWLTDQGVPDHEAEDYVLGVRNGGKLVTLEADDDRAAEAIDIMQRHERGTATARGGMPAGAPSTGAATADDARTGTADMKQDTGRTRQGEEETIEVVEEELDVSKRQVEHGGVHVRTYVTEKPVEKQVQVREENVSVDRRPVDRAVSEAEAQGAFKERSIDMTETSEEVVVDKQARVVEEVVLRKDARERTETVSDTVRRTDVEIEGSDEQYTANRGQYEQHHGEHFATSGRGYDEFEPAYRYGVELAHHPEYAGSTWNDIAPAAREHWEQKNAGTWSEFEPAIRYGYERGPDERRA
ncbi:MAG: YsnF/AvaK domain-containing protein [Trueperaceae bacterium]|nr:YsnF/AvaK domain-containing protein [Trueperaceae bacterium]